MNIIAFDPGETTGVARAKLTGPRTYELIDVAQITWDKRFEQTWNFLLDPEVHCGMVIAEDFRLYASAAQHLINNMFPAVKVIGAIEAFAWMLNIPVHLEPPASRMNVTIPDIDAPALVDMKHARDAYRHLRYWVLVHGKEHF